MNETYAFIEAERTTHGVAFLCRLLKAARSSFHAWLATAKNRAARRAADQTLVHEITVIHVGSRQTCGVPRVHAEPRRLGRRVNRKWVARLMREHGIQGVTRRKRRSPTRPDRKARPAPDLIGRDFHAEVPGTKMVGDITALPTGEGRLHLACRLDLATREVVGYSMADHHRAELVVDALDMAHGRAALQPGCVTHSDRGSEYTSTRFRDRITELSLRQSCGRTGTCFDNAAAESCWALLKKRSAPASGPTGPPPVPTSSTSSRRSTTAAACADTRSSATSPRPKPGNGTDTPSRHNHRVPKITGKLHATSSTA
ncbi:IS3 family transposase [Streptomyces sp. NPDC006435]|uniref:IS3 family transposase n=1 Tax=Streptomyces sp. NPDC006435 TaxID=3154300 RepID=UPI0033A2A089